MWYNRICKFEFFKGVNVKVTKIVEVKFAGVYCGWSSLEVTDQDGSEIRISMTKEQWKELRKSVVSKCESIETQERSEFEDQVEAEVEKRLESQSSDV